jgi:XTP/dITP diphosphohydrolase
VKKIVLATGNPGKIREFQAALKENFEVLGLAAIEPGDPPEETGSTFEENARIKAEAYSLRTDRTVLAEDSGLEVDALDGGPGVRSARYGGEGLDDHGRVLKLLEDMQKVPDERRTARYRAVIAVAFRGTVLSTFEGRVEGRIIRDLRGENGFGYDPVFFHDDLGKTFAQISTVEKQQLSHRGAAIRSFLAGLQDGRLTIP